MKVIFRIIVLPVFITFILISLIRDAIGLSISFLKHGGELVAFKKNSNESDMVLDNTMGVGTCPLASKELNRKFIGIEKEPKYYDLAVTRVFG